MATTLSSSKRRKTKKFWGGNHLRDEYKPLPRSLRYNVETLEPRYLLSVTPVALTNATNDGTKAADSAYVTAVANAVQTVIVGKPAQGNNVIPSVIGSLSYLGQQVDKTSLTDATASANVPFLNQNSIQLGELASSDSSFGSQAGKITFGSLLMNDTDSATQNNLFSEAVSTWAAGTDLTSTSLAKDLQNVGQTLFGNTFTVTDNSTTSLLDFTVSFTADTMHSVPIDIGASASEYNLDLQSEATGAPNAQLETKLSATYDITANLTSFDTAYKTPISGSYTTTKQTSDEVASFGLNTSSSSFQQSVQTVGGALPSFGLEFGVIGAGSRGILENGTHVDSGNSSILDLGSVQNLAVGMSVIGNGLANGTTITSIDATHNKVTLSNSASSLTGDVTIGQVNGALVNSSAFVEGSVLVTNGSQTVTLSSSSVSSLTRGMTVQGVGIQAGTTISGISGNTVTLSAPAIGTTGYQMLTFQGSASFSLNEQVALQFTAHSLSFGNSGTGTLGGALYQFFAPVTSANALAANPQEIGTAAMANTAELNTGVIGFESNANLPGNVTGLNTTGSFTLYSANLFDGHAALVQAGSPDLANLARISNADILVDANNADTFISELNAALQSQVPFTSETLADAYDFGTAAQLGFVNALQYTTMVLAGAASPGTYSSGKYDSTNLNGSTSFNLEVILDDGTITNYTISLSATTGRTLVSLASDLQNAFANAVQTTVISGASISTGQTSISVSTNAGLFVGMGITGGGIAANTTISSITAISGGYQINFSKAATGNASSTSLTFTRVHNLVTDAATKFTVTSNGSTLQIISAITDIQYYLNNFSSDTPTTGTLNLGFNSYGSVALYANGAVDSSANYQIPGVLLTSSSGITLTDFGTETQFGIQVNFGTDSDYGSGYIPVSLAAGAYSASSLASSLTTALQQALLADGFDTSGVHVRTFTNTDGSIAIQFYGGDDIYQMAIQDIATPGSPSSIGKFHLTTTSVTAPYFDYTYTSNGVTSASTRVYLNGNFTTGLLDNLGAAGSLTDLVNDLQLALVASGALSLDGASGITVNSTGNQLVFIAANPGSGANQISSFTITDQVGLTSLNILNGTASSTSLHWAMASSVTKPSFVTIQDLETILQNAGVMQSGASGDYDSTTETFKFPIDFTITSGASQPGFGDLSVPLSFASTYGSVSDLQSTDTVNVNRVDHIKFNFGFNVLPQSTSQEVLYADLPVVIPLWDIPANQTLQSSSPLLFQISTDNGVIHTIQLNQVAQADGTSLFYNSTSSSVPNSTPTTDTSAHAADFITALNAGLLAAGLQITASFSAEDSYGRPQVVFSTAAGAYHELVVTVPTTSSGVVSVNDSAWTSLGFGPSTGTTSTQTSDANNQITAAAGLQFTVVGSNNTIPTNANFYITLPDGTQSGFALNPSNLPANASVQDVVDELNYEISSNASFLGSSYGAIGTSNLTMSVSSANSTATLTGNIADPTPYVTGTNIGAGYGLTPTMTVTGAGIPAGTTITSVSYIGGKVVLGLSTQPTASSAGETVTVGANPQVAQYNTLSKLIASAVTTTVSGVSTTKIVFTLNPAVFGPLHQTWSLQVAKTYLQQLDNPASVELGFSANTVSDSAIPTTGITSTIISPATFTNWATANVPASFQISINGSSYVTVSVAKSALNGDNSIAGLIAALNTTFASTVINLSIPGNPNATVYHLSDFVTAQATNGGTDVIIRLINSPATGIPAVTGMRMALTSGANAMGSSVLGFFNTDATAPGPTEYIFGQRGAEAIVNSPELIGTLTVSGTFTATGQIGIVNFNVGTGTINETIAIDYKSTNLTSTLLDLPQAITDANDPGSLLYQSYVVNVLTTTTADALLANLSFPGASSITGLTIPADATIDILYPTSGANSITDFTNLPPAKMTYTDTNGMQLLTSLSFNDITNSLMRIGDLISDWMTTNVGDPFSSSLLYSKDSLQQIDDVGADFKALVEAIAAQPAGSLQTAEAVLENGLGLAAGSIQFSILNTTTESNKQLSNGGELALQISFDWIKSLTQTLPLSVDLATMYDKASANNGSGQTPKDDLLQLSSIGGNAALNVILTAVSSLNVNLTLVVAQSIDSTGVVSANVVPVSIQPEAIINQPSGNLFQTKFFLEADNLTGALPAGVNYLQLTNGSVVIDATGQTDIPFSSQSSTGLLILTNSTGQNTASLTPNVNGTTVTYDSAGDKAYLVQGVTDLPFSAPIVTTTVNSVTTTTISGSGIFTVNGVQPAVNSQILVNSADTYTFSATSSAGGNTLTGISASIIATFHVGQIISGVALPAGTTITAISGTTITLSNAVSGTGQQTNGIFFAAQDATAANGLYTVTKNDSGGYVLTLVKSISAIDASVSNPAAIQKFVVTSSSSSTIANQVFQSGSLFFTALTTTPNNLDANGTPFVYDLAAASTFAAPTIVKVLAASAAPITPTSTSFASNLWTLNGTGNLVIDGQTFHSTDNYTTLGSTQIILNHQVDPTQNGLYTLSFTGTNWKLTQSVPTVSGFLANSTTNVSGTAVSAAGLWTITGSTGTLTINGVNYTSSSSLSSVQVILSNQTNAAQDGWYNLSFSGGKWVLTQFPTPATLNVAVRYQILSGTAYGNTLMAAYNGAQFAVMLQPASFSYNLQTINGSKSEVLPYTVAAATATALGGSPAVAPIAAVPGTSTTDPIPAVPGFAAVAPVASYSNGVWTSIAKVNINSEQFVEADGQLANGIDGVTTLTVGSLVLVKNEVGANAWENGVYVVTSVGVTGTSSWTMQRASFAALTNETLNLRVAVDQGNSNTDTRWVQTNTALANSAFFSAGDDVTFSNALGPVYEVGAAKVPWIVTTITGASQANLPLQLEQVNDDGSVTLINHDLGGLTADSKTALGQDGATLTNDPLYRYYESLSNGVYSLNATPVFTSADIVIPSLSNFYTSITGGTLFFNPSTSNWSTLTTTSPNNAPALDHSATASSVLTQLQNGFYIGDALDLALFSIQSAIDEALGIEFPLLGTSLNLYTSYVEQIRAKLSNAIRTGILANPLTPVDDVRDAIFAALGNNPGGLGYLTDETQISVQLWNNGVATNFNFDHTGANYISTPLGLKNQVATGVSALTFSIQLAGGAVGTAGSHDDKIDAVNLGNSSIGANISTTTGTSQILSQASATPTGPVTQGGVDLKTVFNFNFGFGVSISDGFFIFNPTASSATPKPMIDIKFTAQLTGNVASSTITSFIQNDYSSTLQNLQVNVLDGRALTDTTAAGGDGYASGFFGDALFDIDDHITGGLDPLGRNTSAGGMQFATVDDLRLATELGPNVNPLLKPALKPSALLNVAINADADIDLIIQSKQAGLVPAIETDLVIGSRFGSGAASSFNLKFNNAALVGLGDSGAGAQVLTDYGKYYDATTADNNSAAYNALTADQKTAVDTEFQNSSPIWRFDRTDLVSNSQSGNIFYDFQNLQVDVYDYLTGSFFKSLLQLESVVAPMRPVLDVITKPLPGTSWMPNGGLTLLTMFPSNLSPKSTSPQKAPAEGSKGAPTTAGKVASYAAKFQLVIEILSSIDNMLGPLATLAAQTSASAPWQHAQAALGGQGGFSNKPVKLNGLTDLPNAQNLQIYKEAQADKYVAANTETRPRSNAATENSFPIPGETETPAQQNASNISRIVSALSETVSNPDKFYELQNGNFFSEGTRSGFVEKVKGALNDNAVQNDKRAGQYSISVGLTGGAFYLDAFSPGSILNILNGVNANLLEINFPTLTATFAYMKTFPLPAFPPLELRLGVQFTISLDINLGYDTNGFYWNTIDPVTGKVAPMFSFAVQFSVGVGLDFGVVNVSIDLFFKLTVGFIWNDVSGTGFIHQSDIDYLTAHGKSLFAVELKGELGFHFEIDAVLLFFTIPIFEYTYTFTLFDVIVGGYTGHIELGTVTGNTLQLNMGPHAGDRNFVDISNRNETFTIYSYNPGGVNAANGETVIVEFSGATGNYYEEFTGIKQVVGYAGVGDSAIYADKSIQLTQDISLVGGGTISSGTVLGALDYAVVDFYGGAGNVILQAGASYSSSYVTAYGRSRLVGGTGTSFLDGANSTSSLDLVAGTTTSTIQGSRAGGDNIVAQGGSDILYGNGANDTFTFATGFNHDRIYVTGNGNTVNFNGLTLGVAGGASPVTIGAITTPITFQFGQLVDSAVTGNSTVFFAVDPSEQNSIDTWIGGKGNDTFTVFFFAPDQTLTLKESAGANTYNVYLGDPTINYYVQGDTRNIGHINIQDTSSSVGQVNLTQLFSNTISYDNTFVSNGREQMLFNSGLPQKLNVSLDAPDSTLYWGNSSSPLTYTLQAGGNISVGHLVLLGNVLLTSNTVIHLTHTFVLDYDIALVGGTTLAPATIEFDITSDNPSVDANFVLENNNAKTNTPSQLMISSVNSSTAPNGLGIGDIFLNILTGSVLNLSGTDNTGIIELGQGALVILALETIGTTSSPINVKVDVLAAKTSEALNPNASYGIYLYSTGNLNLTGFGTVGDNPIDNVLGVTTTNGDIRVELAPGFTLTYYQLTAGGTGNITIIADHINITTGFQVIENLLQSVPHTYTYSYIVFEPIYSFFYTNYIFFSVPFFYFFYVPVIETFTYTWYTQEILPTQVTINASQARIQGSGDLVFQNSTLGNGIQVGDSSSATPANTLLVSDEVLSTVVTGFATLTIGRPKPGSGLATGTVSIAHAENFTQARSVELQGSNLVMGFSVSATNLLAFNAYNVGTNSVTFSNASNVYQASTLVLTTDQTSVLSLQGLFQSTAAGGSVQVTTGGELHIDGAIQANHGNASKISLIAGGEILLINVNQIVNTTTGLVYDSLSAYDGLASDTLSEIDLTSGTNASNSNIGMEQSTTHISNIIAANMNFVSTGSINLVTQMDTLIAATATSLAVSNKTLTAPNWTIDYLNASSGSITIADTDTTAGIQLVRTTSHLLGPLISTVSGQSVTINANGAFTGASTGSNTDISTGLLKMRTGGISDGTTGTNLLISATQLDIIASSGGIQIANTDVTTLVTKLETTNGLISFKSNESFTVVDVVSDTTSTLNTITLTTTPGSGGTITLGTTTTGVISGGALGTVTLNADGFILGAKTGTDTTSALTSTLDEVDTITGAIVSLVTGGSATSGGNAIDVAVKTAYLDAVAGGNGQILIYALSSAQTGSETSENIFLHNLDSALGFATNNVVVYGQASTGSILPLNFITGSVNSNSANLTLETSGTITEQTAPLTAQDITAHLVFHLHAGLLTTVSTGTSYLDTSVTGLDAQVLGTGNLSVTARGTLDVYRATTQNGTISIFGDTALDADVIQVGTISAGKTGGLKNDVTITATDGDILNLNATDANDAANFASVVSHTGALTGLTAALFTANTAFGIQSLRTQVDTLVASSTQNASSFMNLTQTGDITIQSVSMVEGNFVLTSNANISIVSLATDTTQSLVQLTTTGGSITQNSATANTVASVIGFSLDVEAITGITLTTRTSSLVALNTGGTDTSRANIALINLNTSELDINAVEASHGNIDLTTGGDLVLKNLLLRQTNYFSTPTGGTGIPGAYHINVTTGGTITGGTTGTGSGATPNFDFVTDTLTLTGTKALSGLGDNSTLVTEVSTLTATSTGTGDIRDTNRGALELIKIDANNGAIFIQNDAAMVVDIVQIDTTATLNTITLQNTLGSTPADITLGTINAGALGDVTITSTGLIIGLTGNLITGHNLTLTAQGLAGNANKAIDVNVLASLLIANATGSGQIVIHTAGDLTLDQVDTALGDIYVTTTGAASLLISEITAGTVVPFVNNVYLTVAGTIGVPTPANLSRTNKITADLLTVRAVGATYLDTTIHTLDATVSAAGFLTVDQTDGLTVTQATTFNGAITINADKNQSVANYLNSNILVGQISAGTGVIGKSDVTLTTTAGYLQDIDNTSLLTGKTFTATAFAGIHAQGIYGFNTAVTTLEETSTATLVQGDNVTIVQTGDILIDVVAMTEGDFTLTSDGNITVNSLSSDLLASNITLITSAGFIDQSAGTLSTFSNISGYNLSLQATDGILLNTDISILYASNSGGTDTNRDNIVLANLSTNELDVHQVIAASGNIDLSTDGNLVLKNLPSLQSVYFSTPANGAASLTPYHIGVTASGSITGGTTGTGSNSLFDFVTDDLTLTAGAAITGLGDTTNSTLVTEVSKLTATTSGAGAISDTNRGTLELVNVDADNGLIFIQNDAAMIVDAVKIDTTATLNTITLQNTLGSTVANITLGTINACSLGDVTMTSTGAILGGLGNLITGHHLTLTAEGLEGATNPAIDVNVLASTLTANATGSGEIIIHTAGDLTLDQVDTVSGDIHITTTGTASLLISEVEAGTGVSFANDVYLTVAGSIGEYKPTPADPNRTYKITSDLLKVQAGGMTYLDTVIQTLDATVTGSGFLTVDQTGDLNIYNAKTHDGAITVTAIPANQHIGANIFVGTITGGLPVPSLGDGASDVTLTANGGFIKDLDVTTITDPAVVPPINYTPLLTGATFTATADLGVQGLHTDVTTLNVTTTDQSAFVLINEQDSININHVLMPFGNFTLTAGETIDVNDLTANTSSSTVNLTSLNSRIQMEMGKINANILNATAKTGAQALTNIHDLTATITGAAGDVNVRNDGSLTLEHVYTPNGTFTLNLLHGALTPSQLTNPVGTPPVYHVYANDIVINTTAGIGTPTNYLSVYADEVDQASASVSGGIFIYNYKQNHSAAYPNGFELHEVKANNGPIVIGSVGNTYARDVEIFQDANNNDITLITTNGGNMLLNFVGTGLSDGVPGAIAPLNGLATFFSGGNITVVDPSNMLQAVNVMAKGISFNAQTGIGDDNGNGPSLTGEYLTAHTTIGSISATNRSGTDFFISDFSTGHGNLTFKQTGGGALHADDLFTYGGNIMLTIENGAYLFLGHTISIGNTTLVSDHINFWGGTDSVFGTGTLNIHPDNPAQYVQLNSFFASTIYEVANTLEISKLAFSTFFSGFQNILIGNQSSPQLTYMYYDVYPYNTAYTGQDSGYADMTQTAPSDANSDFFRISDLYLTPTDIANLQAASQAEIYAILNAEENIGDNVPGGDVGDESQDEADEFAYSTSSLIPAIQVAHGSDHGHQAHVPADSGHEHHSWIDQAVVTSAILSPLVNSRKPKSWLDKFRGAFRGR